LKTGFRQLRPPGRSSDLELAEKPACGKFGRNPQRFRLLFAYGRRTRIDSSATDVREDLLHVL
jgi:hypothetical protein